MSGFIGSPAWKKFMAKVYGIGAAVVIMGAMFKIMHWPGAGPMLVCGLSTEVIIFFLSAFEPLHEDIDWSLVYPELSGIVEEDKGTITEQLDNMLEEAKIGPELISSLGDGIRNLSDQAGKLSDITEASVATEKYVTNVQSAAKNVGALSDASSNAAESLTGLSVTSADSTLFSEQVNKVSKNLGALNASYELQVQGSNEYQKATANLHAGISDLTKNLSDSAADTKKYQEKISQLSTNLGSLNASYELQLQSSNEQQKATTNLYAGMSDLTKNLNDSIEDTKKFKEQMSQLSSNLESLNVVYGNMLTAMRK